MTSLYPPFVQNSLPVSPATDIVEDSRPVFCRLSLNLGLSGCFLVEFHFWKTFSSTFPAMRPQGRLGRGEVFSIVRLTQLSITNGWPLWTPCSQAEYQYHLPHTVPLWRAGHFQKQNQVNAIPSLFIPRNRSPGVWVSSLGFPEASQATSFLYSSVPSNYKMEWKYLVLNSQGDAVMDGTHSTQCSALSKCSFNVSLYYDYLFI